MAEGALPRGSLVIGATGVVDVGLGVVECVGAALGAPGGTAVLGGVPVESLGVFDGDVEGPLVEVAAKALPLAHNAAIATAEVSLRIFM